MQTYKTTISEDNQVQRLVKQITEVVEQNAEECKVTIWYLLLLERG